MYKYLSKIKFTLRVLYYRFITIPQSISGMFTWLAYRGKVPVEIKRMQRAEKCDVVIDTLSEKEKAYLELMENALSILRMYRASLSESRMALDIWNQFALQGHVMSADTINRVIELMSYKYPILAFRDILFTEKAITKEKLDYWKGVRKHDIVPILLWRHTIRYADTLIDNTPEWINDIPDINTRPLGEM